MKPKNEPWAIFHVFQALKSRKLFLNRNFSWSDHDLPILEHVVVSLVFELDVRAGVFRVENCGDLTGIQFTTLPSRPDIEE
jgi:hypothetical protein